MADPAVTVVPVDDATIAALDPLAAQAEREGIRNVRALVEGWRDGSLRFDGPGERLLAAVAGTEVVGVGGLTACPHVPGALRVRRFYVAPGWRRRGVARTLARPLLDGAWTHTDLVTCNARASAAAPLFWESLGFTPVDRAGITHERRRDGRA